MHVARTFCWIGIVLPLCGLAAGGSGLALLLQPAKYRAQTRVKIERSAQPPSLDSPGGYGYPYPIQVEFEVIQSEVILGKVIAVLDLNRAWGRKYADDRELKTLESCALIKNRLELRPVKNTSLIDMRFTGEDPVEAARVVNTLAGVFRDHYLEKNRQLELAGSGNFTVDMPIILDRATTPSDPISPNRTVAFGLLIVGAFLVAAGLYFMKRALSAAAAATATDSSGTS